MTAPTENERLALLYKYACQLATFVASGRVTRVSLGRSQMDQWAIIKALELIGEEAWQLSKMGCELGPNIPLSDIGNMRHHLVHHYEGINWHIAEEAVFEDVPELVRNLKPILLDRGIKPYEAHEE